MGAALIPEKLFQELLIAGKSWRVTSGDYIEKESKVLIRVEEPAQLGAEEKCLQCGSGSAAGYDPAPERRWRPLNVCQLASEIVCALPRDQCKQCQKVYTVRAPWEGRGRGFTQEFEAFALVLMRAMPVKKAGEILGGNGSEIVASALCACGRGVGGVELGERGMGGSR